jgi:hypothetical protein
MAINLMSISKKYNKKRFIQETCLICLTEQRVGKMGEDRFSPLYFLLPS